jgi:hypothetical protein
MLCNCPRKLAKATGPQGIVSLDDRLERVLIGATALIGIRVKPFHQHFIFGLGIFRLGIFIQAQSLQSRQFVFAKIAAQFGLRRLGVLTENGQGVIENLRGTAFGARRRMGSFAQFPRGAVTGLCRNFGCRHVPVGHAGKIIVTLVVLLHMGRAVIPELTFKAAALGGLVFGRIGAALPFTRLIGLGFRFCPTWLHADFIKIFRVEFHVFNYEGSSTMLQPQTVDVTLWI